MEFGEYFVDQKVNIELMYAYDEVDDSIYCVVRVRPWKGRANDGSMILGAGEDELTALWVAAALHKANAWQTLDWSKRMTIAGADAALERVKRTRALDSPLPQKRRKGPFEVAPETSEG